MDLVAHVKWFTSSEPMADINPITVLEYTIVIASVALGLVFLYWLDKTSLSKKINKTIDKKLKPGSSWVPTIVRLSTAVLLLLNTWAGYVLAPNILNEGTTTNIVAISILSLAGFLLLFGLFIRSAAVLIVLGYLCAFLTPDGWQALDHLEYIAIAAYLFFKGGGKLRLPIKGLVNLPSKIDKYQHFAYPSFRIIAGIGLAVLAFSEKLFNIGLSQEFLNSHSWNLLEFAGVSDRYFIFIAGGVELLIGLALVFNYAIRLTTLALLATMTVTAVLLGAEEVLGHLFAVGLVAAVWIPDYKPKKTRKT